MNKYLKKALGIFLITMLVAGGIYFTTPNPQPLAPSQAIYEGVWRNPSGDMIAIQKDGRGSYHGPHQTLRKLPVVIGTNTIEFAWSFTRTKFTITDPPHQEPDGRYTMALDEEVFHKTDENNLP